MGVSFAQDASWLASFSAFLLLWTIKSTVDRLASDDTRIDSYTCDELTKAC